VRQFIRGEVEAHNGKFAPSAAQLARAVRQADEYIEIRRRYAGRKQLERANTENIVVLSPEERARRYAELQRLAGKIKHMGDAK
jgi:hypothetical protein